MKVFSATPLAVADSAQDDQPTAVATAPCQNFQTNENYFFDDYESHDYSSGFLAMHFKLKQPYNDGRQWNDYGFYIYNQSCAKEFHDVVNPKVSIDKGVQQYSIRFSSATHYDFWDDETDVREQCAECSGDISLAMTTTGEQGSTIGLYADIDGVSAWMQSDALTILPPQPVKTPVLIIPGILGTELSYNGNILWPNLVLSAISDDAFMNPLEMDTTGAPLAGVQIGSVIHSVNYVAGKFDYIDGLISTLTKNGYVEGTTLFTFSYDWRVDPTISSSALKAELDNIAARSPGSTKIDIIAHSYGGLLLKHYILQNADPRIGKIIFVGVPQLGTPAAAQALIFGDDLGIPILNSQEVFKLAQNMPMIYDLLPSSEYYKHAAGFFEDLSNITTPQIPSFDADQSLLTAMGKNLRLLNQAALDHTDALDNMDFSKLPYQVSSIVGCGVFTEKTINKMYNGDPTLLQRAAAGPKYRIEGDSGDGTVVMQSAAHDGGDTYYVSGVPHAQLLSNSNSSAAIASLLNGQMPDATNARTASALGSSCNISGKILSFSSSVNVVLTNRTTGAKLVPQQDYNVIPTGNDRHIFIPDDILPTYSVQIQDEVAGGTPENISVHNVSSNSGDNHNTYNYNNQKLDANLLNLTFPKVTAADGSTSTGQDLENIDPTTGDVTTVPPSDQLDGSYNQVPGSATDSGTTTNNSTLPTDNSVPNTSTSPDSSAEDTSSSSTAQDSGQDAQDSSDQLDQSSDNVSSNNSPEDLTSDDSTNTQTKTIQTPNGENIIINVNTMQPPEPVAKSVISPILAGSKLAAVVEIFDDLRKIINGIFF